MTKILSAPDHGVLLRVSGLRTHFETPRGLVKAVDDVSFQLYSGKTTCVVGESGSGKSITACSILQIVEAPGKIVGGQVHFRPAHRADARQAWVELTTLHPRSRTIRKVRGGDISMIFQEPMSSLSPVHTIGNQIVETVRLHEDVSKREARDRAIDLLRQVRIRDPERAVDQYPFEFSGGMRQRAVIAMALSCNPSILIADEPTTALDVTTQAEILNLIKDLQAARDMAVMFITHDMGVVAKIGDYVVVMRDGKVVEQEDVFTLFAAPKHAYTRTLLESVKRLERRTDLKPPESETIATFNAPILEVKDVSVIFPGKKAMFRKAPAPVRAVSGVSLTLHQGESLGIVGESGSGKTTLSRAIASVLRPTVGAIYYSEEEAPRDIFDFQREALRDFRSKVRIVFQDPYGSLNPRMTVFQIVSEPLRNTGIVDKSEQRDRVVKLLYDVGLPADVMDRYPHAFSGGQRQRIGIARAIALDPRIIICDEATSALDVSIRQQVLDLLIKLQRKLHLSFIFIAHDIGVVRYFCDRVAVMRHGEVVEYGPVSKVCDTPDHPYTRELLSAIPHPDPENRRLHKRRAAT